MCQAAHWGFWKKYGKYGNFQSKNMGHIWDFGTFLAKNMGHIWDIFRDLRPALRHAFDATCSRYLLKRKQ